MKIIAFSLLLMLSSIGTCTQEKKEITPHRSSPSKSINMVPFLTKQNDFIYVDKISLETLTDQRFRNASTFTTTGFAVVENENMEYAVINTEGKLVLGFSSSDINLEPTNGLTFYKRELEFQKKMPIWNWEWNILGGGIQKEKTYHRIEIGVVESEQILFQEEIPYLQDSYYLNVIALDDHHVFWNGNLYVIKKNRLKKLDKNITELLENQRFIKASNGNYSINKLHVKNPLYAGLQGTETLSVKFQNQTIELPEINKERYVPVVPKLLIDTKSQEVYAFPQYEKAFPKEITKATTSQIEFIKKVSLVYSIMNSPYFLLGVFNYDEDIWAYEWLYIDLNGIVVDTIDTYNFKVMDQVGNLIWPDRKMIFPEEFNDKIWKFGKINAYQGMDKLYIISVEDEDKRRTKGLWNQAEHRWEIKPEYQDISVLDTDKQIYALRKEQNGLFMLYDQMNKHTIGSKAYQSIYSDGLVYEKIDSTQTIHFYIDLKTGKEYRAD